MVTGAAGPGSADSDSETRCLNKQRERKTRKPRPTTVALAHSVRRKGAGVPYVQALRPRAATGSRGSPALKSGRPSGPAAAPAVPRLAGPPGRSAPSSLPVRPPMISRHVFTSRTAVQSRGRLRLRGSEGDVNLIGGLVRLELRCRRKCAFSPPPPHSKREGT